MSNPTAVSTMDQSKQNSPISKPIEEQATVMLSNAKTTCWWNDQEFSDGQVVECDGKRYACDYGQWVPQD